MYARIGHPLRGHLVSLNALLNRIGQRRAGDQRKTVATDRVADQPPSIIGHPQPLIFVASNRGSDGPKGDQSRLRADRRSMSIHNRSGVLAPYCDEPALQMTIGRALSVSRAE